MLTLAKCKKCVVSAHDRSHTVFQTSKNNQASVDIHKKQGIKYYCLFFHLGSYATVAKILKTTNLEGF